MSPSNDVILLRDMLTRSREETRRMLSEDEHHVFFVARHFLSDYKPTHDDLLSGIVDGGKDGGIDGLYLFSDGFCIRDDQSADRLGRSPSIDLMILQVKNTSGFTEPPIDKLRLSLPELLDLGRDEQELVSRYNPRVIEITRRFLDYYRGAERPTLRIIIGFASLRADFLHPDTRARGDQLSESVQEIFRSAEPAVYFLDAPQLADLARRPQAVTRDLELAENAVSTNVRGGYVGLVRLKEFERFITDGTGKLDAAIFEANVRDYEGETEVNRSIQDTLSNYEDDVDFWWLNNGVTIVAQEVRTMGATKYFQLIAPHIVNGLQTSHEIYKRTRGDTSPDDQRSVLVKIIQVPDSQVRDRIIRATNSQTNLNISSLRATDKVQRQIEEYLLAHNFYYERRKNLYSNRGFPLEKIVSIDEMGQALLSAVAQTPHVARSGVSRVFDDDIYATLFSQSNPIRCYLTALSMLRHAQGFLLSSPETRDNTDNFSFHLTMAIAITHSRASRPNARNLDTDYHPLPRTVLSDLLDLIQQEYAYHTRMHGETLFERIAKSGTIPDRLRDKVLKYTVSTSRRN